MCLRSDQKGSGYVSLVMGVAMLGMLRMLMASNLTPLAPEPEWRQLEAFQHTVTREEFVGALESVYAPGGAWRPFIEVLPDAALIDTGEGGGRRFRLEFADASAARPAPRFWRRAVELDGRPDKPLAGLHVAIDPGHIGGEFARMEERWFQIGKDPPVMEGEMTLRVAKLMKPRLERLGARVSLVRAKNEPVTWKRPKDFRKLAAVELRRMGVDRPAATYAGPGDPRRQSTIQWQSEIFFYRAAEIRARADVVNNKLRPDVVVALHFNAEPWGNPARPVLTDVNHLHVLVNGAYAGAELELEDNRFEMLLRLLQGIHREEIAAGEATAKALARATGLPPYVYVGSNALRVGNSSYLYARNLLANRIYLCPVIYAEPYVMNSREVYERIQAGDYEGVRTVGGRQRPSIFREYADAMVQGLLDHYSRAVQ